MTRTKIRNSFVMVIAAWAAFTGVSRPAPARQASPAAPQSNPATPSAPPSSFSSDHTERITVADLSWLEGRWRGEWGPRQAEQIWTSPKGGAMAGILRVIEDDKTLVIELFTLVDKPQGIELHFRHFTPSLVPWEPSDAGFLRLMVIDPQRAVFENPVNGVPKRVTWVRLGGDSFLSRSEIVPDKGDPEVIEITYHRKK